MISTAPIKPRQVQWIVFAVVSTAFTNIYITQPLLPQLELAFATDTVSVARTVSAVLLGIAIANLPFGYLTDRLPVRPLIVLGGGAIALAGFACVYAATLEQLIVARFVQGLFIPCLTTCLAAWLAKTLPPAALNVAMGAYVAATIFGGMCGRLLGGFVHAGDAWRGAFISAGALVLIAATIAALYLPEAPATHAEQHRNVRYRSLLMRLDLLPIFICAAAGQAIFSPVFNTVPYRLAEAPMALSTASATLVYLVYLIGVVMGPAAGRLSNRLGNGSTLMLGAVTLVIALLVLRVPTVSAVVAGLLGVCAGFFGVHAAAVGALNRRLAAGQGRANALYVLCYYLGAWGGIRWSAWVYQHWGWDALIACAIALCAIPFGVGWLEQRQPPGAIPTP